MAGALLDPVQGASKERRAQQPRRQPIQVRLCGFDLMRNRSADARGRGHE